MKLKELLESYFPGLYHITPKEDLSLKNLRIIEKRTGMGKPPKGFWLAKGLSWHRWAEGADYSDTSNQHLYRVKLKPSASIFQINKSNYEKLFTKPSEYIKGEKKVDWEKIINKYDGVQIYRVKGFPTLMKVFALAPFSGWDVPSVVVFNKDAVQSIENLGLVKDAIKKSRKK